MHARACARTHTHTHTHTQGSLTFQDVFRISWWLAFLEHHCFSCVQSMFWFKCGFLTISLLFLWVSLSPMCGGPTIILCSWGPVDVNRMARNGGRPHVTGISPALLELLKHTNIKLLRLLTEHRQATELSSGTCECEAVCSSAIPWSSASHWCLTPQAWMRPPMRK